MDRISVSLIDIRPLKATFGLYPPISLLKHAKRGGLPVFHIREQESLRIGAEIDKDRFWR